MNYKHIGGKNGTRSGAQKEKLNTRQEHIALKAQITALIDHVRRLKHGAITNSDEFQSLQSIELIAIGLGIIDEPAHHTIYLSEDSRAVQS